MCRGVLGSLYRVGQRVPLLDECLSCKFDENCEISCKDNGHCGNKRSMSLFIVFLSNDAQVILREQNDISKSVRLTGLRASLLLAMHLDEANRQIEPIDSNVKGFD